MTESNRIIASSLSSLRAIVTCDSPNSQDARPHASHGDHNPVRIGRGIRKLDTVTERDAGGVMTVPLIGIVADRKSASYGAWVDIPTDAISHTYVSAIQEAGGAPLLFPSVNVHVDDPERLLDLVDGLFLPGGRDLDASLYASEAHPSNDKPLRVRDELEIALTGSPVSAACPCSAPVADCR